MRQFKESDKKFPGKTMLGLIFIMVGILSLISQAGLLPASITLQSKELHTAPGQTVSLRYNYVNEGTAQARFSAAIFSGDTNNAVKGQSFSLSPKTIFSGILSFQAPVTPGTYTYTLRVTGDNGHTETDTFKVVVE